MALALAAAAWSAPSAAAPVLEERKLAIPEVPFLPQTRSLCGGAALSMVLRYWGEAGVRPADFKGALREDGHGITADTLRELAEARGYRALALQADRAEAAAQLARGRPLIALAAARKGGGYHYVVLLAWANGSVLLHDPALGPFRVVSEAEWQRRWDATGRWTLLVLPPAEPRPKRQDTSPTLAADGPCEGIVTAALAKADQGDVVSARQDLAAAASLCPGSSRALREAAGLEFRLERWQEAAELAEEAVAREPGDLLSWRLLATSRFLEGKPEAALEAWNEVGEPKLDLVRIEGLSRTPFRTVYDYLGGEDGDEVLTPAALRRAQRRLAALPAAGASRVSYRPVQGGRVDLEATLAERPTLEPLRPWLLESGAHALVDHAAALDLANLTSSGDAARVFWRWQPNRPQLALSAAAPRALGLPGIVTAQVLWDEQTYELAGAAAPSRETRKGASLSLQDWWWADSSAALTLAVDEWSDRGRALSLAGAVEHRALEDRVALGGRFGGWAVRSGAPFYAGSLWARARTRAAAAGAPQLRLDVQLDAASANAPLALWSGAGTGLGRELLLRAHPLLRDGVVDGACFGRQVVRAGAEGDAGLAVIGPLVLRAAVFVDAARVLAPAPGLSARRTFVDVGTGLRLRLPGRRSTLRADVATPWGALRPQLSVGWQQEWR
jgi:tetratricopeptide (TPR) repeat protein